VHQRFVKGVLPARLIIVRLIVYQRRLIPLPFAGEEIRDIKTIRAGGEDGKMVLSRTRRC
jgi:hypothetical protein